MAYTTIKELFTAICDAIRGKDGTTDKINHQDIPSRISAITTGGTGVDTTIASNGASASDIISGKKAWVNNELITGIHTCQGGTDISDASTVSSDQIASGITVYGQNGKVTGTHICEINEGGVDVSDASNVTADQIAKGVIVYGRNGKVTGIHECSEVEEIPTVEQATPSITVSSSGLITASVNQSEGYVAGGTKSTTKQLTTKETATYTPGTSDQTIAASTYLTGTQTIKGDANLLASNIKNGVSIFGVTGSYEGETSSSVPVYRWGKYTMLSSGYTESITTGHSGTHYGTGYESRILYANKSFNSNTGVFTLSDPYSTEKIGWSDQYNNWQSYPYYYGDYSDGSMDNTVYQMTNMSKGGNNIVTSYSYKSDKWIATADSIEKGSYVEDVYHISSSAFPEDGVQDGYWYVSQGQITE